jgi:ATP-dependent DNA ligase
MPEDSDDWSVALTAFGVFGQSHPGGKRLILLTTGILMTHSPFANPGEEKSGRWLKPVIVGQFEFVEWTTENHLRHTSFIALREDKKAKDVRRE